MVRALVPPTALAFLVVAVAVPGSAVPRPERDPGGVTRQEARRVVVLDR